jgi:zinc transporter ZupT
VAIVVGFEVSPGIGLVTTLAVLLHEFPEGITATGILIYTKTERRKLIFYSILVAIATPIGALISYGVLKNISEAILGALLSLAAGSFIYISTADLIPETHKVRNIKNAFVLLSGVLILVIIGSFFG